MHLKNHRLGLIKEFPYLCHIIANDLKDTAEIEHRRWKLCSLENDDHEEIGFLPQRHQISIIQTVLLQYILYMAGPFGQTISEKQWDVSQSYIMTYWGDSQTYLETTQQNTCLQSTDLIMWK